MFQHYITIFFIIVVLIALKLQPNRSQDLRHEPDKCISLFKTTTLHISPSLQLMMSMQVSMSKIQGPVCRKKLVLLYLCMILLQQSYAPEPNPGPRAPKFPCGVCQKAVRWTTPGVQCDSCKIWYHQQCMGMCDEVYYGLHNVSWDCFVCGLPNFSFSLFDLTLHRSVNSFDILQTDTGTNSTCKDHDISFGPPTATSSPKGGLPQPSPDKQRTFSNSLCSTRQDSNELSHPSFIDPNNHQTVLISKTQRSDLPLKVISLNCQSICGKKASFETMCTSIQADIVIGTESWLNEQHTSAEIFPSEYRAYRKDRLNKKGGGVFILVRNDLNSSEPEELKSKGDTEMLWVKLTITGSSHLYIGAFYRPPSADSPDYISDLDNSLSYIPPNSHIWLSGDFNLGDIDWTNNTVQENATRPKLCKQLIDVANDRFLQQLVDKPTRVTTQTSNTLDLFFTNNSTLVNNLEVIPSISDHEAIYIEGSLRPHKIHTPPRSVPQYRKADFVSIKEALLNYTREKEQTDNQSANELWLDFKNLISLLIEKHIPFKNIRNQNKHKPWISKQVTSARRKTTKLYKRMRKTHKEVDINKYKTMKAKTQKLERQSYNLFISDLIEPEQEDRHSNLKRFWSYIKSLKKDNTGISPLKDKGRLFDSAVDKANILNRQYQSVFTHETADEAPIPDGDTYPEMPDLVINPDGIEKLLHGINPRKASGPDNIPAHILKECASEISPILTNIFNTSLKEGLVPEDWRQANVSAIYKKGSRQDPANYRPVSLTCICCKLLEHCIVRNIMDHLESHNILTDCQHGFRAKRSCETQIITLLHELSSSLDKSIQTDMIVLDFSKAFDRVPHRRLLNKIHHYGIRGRTHEWVTSFLCGRTQRVVVEGETSEAVPVVSGVPQGSVLGPLLFLMFINDLPNNLSSDCRLFADDAIVYRQIHTERDQQILQQDLASLSEWEKKWGMEFHPQKCSYIKISKSKRPKPFSYTLKGITLTEEKSIKYLGVDIQSNLSWTNHINRITKKAHNMLGFLRRNIKSATRETKTTAYINTLVRSTLEYCAAAWNPHQQTLVNKLEMTQRRAARYVCNRYNNRSSVTSMLTELNWETLESRRVKAQLTFLFKIQNNLIDIEADKYLKHKDSSRLRSTHSKQYTLYQPKTDQFKYSFFPRTIRHWNSLPASVAEAPSLVLFKRELSAQTF